MAGAGDLIIHRNVSGFLYAVLWHKGRVEALAVDSPNRILAAGGVYHATITRHDATLGLVFLRLPDGSDAVCAAGQNVPATGTSLLIQITTWPERGKYPVASPKIAIAGRYVVFEPFGTDITVSRKLAGAIAEPLLKKLQSLSIGGGMTLRSSVGLEDADHMCAEALGFYHHWQNHQHEPVIFSPPNAAQRVWRDGVRPNRIVTDGCDWAEMDAVRDDGIFSRLDIDVMLESLLQPQVKLNDSLTLWIEPTRALTAIDIDSSLQPSRANALALPEIARQIRLRGIAGHIVIDGVGRKSQIESALKDFREILSRDPVQTTLHGVSALGWIELTRARRDAALADIYAQGGYKFS